MKTLHARIFLLFAALLAVATVARADEKVLYDKASAFNNIIVTEEGGYRVLRFERNGARQSITKLGDPSYLGFAYTKVAFVGLAFVDDPRRIMVVGIGGGTMPMFLRKYDPNATIDAVDIDPDVVQVAKDFFGFREDDKLKAHVGDGRAFIENVKEPYDVIFLDAFGTRNVPPPLTTIEFMRAVRRAVKPDGVVIGNIWGPGANRLYDDMVRTYQEAFDELYLIEVLTTSNRILFGLPRRQPLDRAALAQRARKTTSARGFPFDLGAFDERQFHRLSQKTDAGRVLRDAETGQPAGAAAR